MAKFIKLLVGGNTVQNRHVNTAHILEIRPETPVTMHEDNGEGGSTAYEVKRCIVVTALPESVHNTYRHVVMGEDDAELVARIEALYAEPAASPETPEK